MQPGARVAAEEDACEKSTLRRWTLRGRATRPPVAASHRAFGKRLMLCQSVRESIHWTGNSVCATISTVSSHGGSGSRYVDHGRPIAAYADLIYVVCPACGARAQIVPRPDLPELRYHSELQYRPRRLVCPGCALTREWVAERRGAALVGVALGGPNDPFFGLALWLQTPCCGRLLWAYNERHLDVLHAYVSADLRERAGFAMGMLGRLPAWIKVATHRSEVLRAIDRLRAQLQRRNPDERSPAAYARPGHPGPRPVKDFYSARRTDMVAVAPPVRDDLADGRGPGDNRIPTSACSWLRQPT